MEDKNIDLETEKVCSHCPVTDVSGFISNGKQYDLDITLPEDPRDILYGTIKDVFKDPIKDAVVKLVEIEFNNDGKKTRIPVSHTFTDKNGEFVFGPLCPGKQYAIDIWVNDIEPYKMDFKCKHEGKCLKIKPSKKCNCK